VVANISEELAAAVFYPENGGSRNTGNIYETTICLTYLSMVYLVKTTDLFIQHVYGARWFTADFRH
jgi:hypothetical protein